MITLTFFKSETHYMGFTCKGHSGYAKEGSDIVCASVSSAIQLTAHNLTKFYPNLVEFCQDEKDVAIELKCVRAFDEADRQLSALEDFSTYLSAQYSDYFTLNYLEV